MTPRPGNHLELIEPLRSFLESFTQELTEQQFIPAFRDELRQLVTSLDGLKQSEETMQQIARGVDRLREVFAPAGNRLLAEVKDLETTMQINASVLKDRATEVLRDLSDTHEQMEAALRSEATLLQDHTGASRESLARTVAEVEERLAGLSTQIERVCRKAESEISELSVLALKSGAPAPVQTQVVTEFTGPVKFDLPDELRELISKTEQFVAGELNKYRQDVQVALISGAREQSERFAKLDKSVGDALSSVGPLVQEELDSALKHLRDQIQSLAQAEAEAIASRSQAQGNEPPPEAASTAAVKAAMSTVENRLLDELADLRKVHKSSQSASERAIAGLIEGFNEASEKQSRRLAEDGFAIKESVQKIEQWLEKLQTEFQQSGQGSSGIKTFLENLGSATSAQSQKLAEVQSEILAKYDSRDAKWEEKCQADWTAFDMLASQLTRAERASTSAAELALADGRNLREKIEFGLKELRERIETGFEDGNERVTQALHGLAVAWSEELNMLREGIREVVSQTADVITRQNGNLEARLQSNEQVSQRLQHELQAEFKRASGLIEERLLSLQSNTEKFTAAVESHVKAVSSEVSNLINNQDQSLGVLKEAIRANYDDNAARLKEVIDRATDGFMSQISLIPQTLERYSHILESFHQSDQLALQGISSDTKNLLRISTEQFEAVASDSGAMKKVFPLLDKKLEKQSGEMDALRKAQMRQDRDFSDLKITLAEIHERQQAQNEEFRNELNRVLSEQKNGFDAQREAIDDVKSSVDSLESTELPNFRRDFASLLATKFEFMETTLNERQEALRTQINERLEHERTSNKKTYQMIALLILLSMVVQVALYFK